MVEQTRLAEHDHDFRDALEGEDTSALVLAAQHLGAGQKTALTVLTRVLAALRNGALVLFDEPELNLHPSLLAAVLRVLHDWLDRFDGYGIIATHSPIGLQEIPGRNVRVLRRVGRVPLIRRVPVRIVRAEPVGDRRRGLRRRRARQELCDDAARAPRERDERGAHRAGVRPSTLAGRTHGAASARARGCRTCVTSPR